ncbi:MAG: glycosyltransferase [Acidobacteriota bacterium]|jgi:UDP:flavonoid glycosyltransferase YjiC (YdhE family)|nr:glycosyltransferase [Acidobacteriota bacterium]
MVRKILYISGSLGLGHIKRDLVIARELRAVCPNIEISWIAADPATALIEEAGERLHPEAANYANENEPAEEAARGGQLNLLKYLMKASKDWRENVETFDRITTEEHFDLVIGDETYELNVGFMKKPELKKSPYVMIYDFIGLDAMTSNPMEWLGIYMWNRIWSKDFKKGRDPVHDRALFIGEEEDVPDKPFGALLPGRREWARALCEFVGYVLPFDPADLQDRSTIRARLGYGEGPLIVCSIGGTAIGKEFLNICGQSFAHLEQRLDSLRMLLVCGPRLAAEELEVPDGVEIRGYVPDLYEHFAASDLAIVQGGGTTTLELTALKRPFIFFPIEGHFEQAQVARRLERHKAGVRMNLSETSPQDLADQVLATLQAGGSFAPIPVDGGRRAAELIAEMI